MSKQSFNSVPATHERRQVPLRVKLLGGAALGLTLLGGIVGSAVGLGHNRSANHHNQGPRAVLLTEAQLEQGFTMVGKGPIVAPDGKAEFAIASPVKGGGQKPYDLFVSTNKGTTWQEVAENIGNGGDIDATSYPATWSPKTVNGQNVLAVLRQNTSNAPDANGNTLPEYVDLFAVGHNGAQKIGEAETEARNLEFNYGDRYGLQEMYTWDQHGNQVTFTTIEPVGGQNPDGSTWVGGMEAGSVTAQVPPAA